MPSAWDDSLDTPTVFDALESFVGGQYSYAKARELAPNQCALLQDCEEEITGQVSTRYGTSQVGGAVGASNVKVDAVGFFNFAPTYTYEIAICNGHIYRNNGGTWTDMGAFTVSDAPSMAQGVNKMYFAAGGDIFSWDGTSLTNISGDGATQAPRNVSIVKWHGNRLIAAGSSIKEYSTDTNPIPDALYLSDVLVPASWGTVKNATQLRPGNGDGQPITAIVPWTNFNIAVFKRRSIWVVGADPAVAISDMPITQIHGSGTVGCVARRSAVQVGSDILFLADDGIRSLAATEGSDQQFELSVPLSFPVQDIIDRINWSSASGAAATFWRNLYLIALPLDSSTTNNYILVYNTVTKAWGGLWTNLPVNQFAIREVSGVPHLMMGLATTNKVVEYLDYTNPANWGDEHVPRLRRQPDSAAD
jgi:hypothetical protein